MGAVPVQTTVPHHDRLGPVLEVVGTRPHAGRLYRCTICGAMAWSAWGRARQHYSRHAAQPAAVRAPVRTAYPVGAPR